MPLESSTSGGQKRKEKKNSATPGLRLFYFANINQRAEHKSCTILPLYWYQNQAPRHNSENKKVNNIDQKWKSFQILAKKEERQKEYIYNGHVYLVPLKFYKRIDAPIKHTISIFTPKPRLHIKSIKARKRDRLFFFFSFSSLSLLVRPA